MVRSASPLYPLDEPYMHPMAAILVGAHHPDRVLRKHIHTITVLGDEKVEFTNALIQSCLQACKHVVPYNLASYPMYNLINNTRNLYNQSVESRKSMVELHNHCCTKEDCPYIIIQKTILNKLG